MRISIPQLIAPEPLILNLIPTLKLVQNILRGVFPVLNLPCFFLYGIGISHVGFPGFWYGRQAVSARLGSKSYTISRFLVIL